ncbi:MAG: HNH endonuclease [Lewinellaceae bacterium]|nr:HNH endonuclease [Lewinellaceae bacterium]
MKGRHNFHISPQSYKYFSSYLTSYSSRNRITGWNVHQVNPKYLGGRDTLDNMVLLHPVCHQQVHHQNTGYGCCADKGVWSA